jgi:hypothetical protein
MNLPENGLKKDKPQKWSLKMKEPSQKKSTKVPS